MMDFIKKALILVEDRRFYDHCGIDFFAIGRALLVNLKELRYAQGGSTITQQLARTKYLHSRKTLFRKISEAACALYLEFKYTKEQILDMYLREVYMGQRRNGTAIRGFLDASLYYFKTLPDCLTHAEAASLVAMVKGPNLYKLHSKSGIARRTMILGLALERDLLTKGQMVEAVRENI